MVAKRLGVVLRHQDALIASEFKKRRGAHGSIEVAVQLGLRDLPEQIGGERRH
jgi:hypothetical protein